MHRYDELDTKFNILDILEAEFLPDLLDEHALELIGQQVVEDYDADQDSRKGWVDIMEKARKLAMQVADKKNFPWPNAANIKFPLVSVAAVQFASRAVPALLNDREIVRSRVYGADPNGTKVARARRVADHMNWQVLEEDEGWYDEMDRGLHVLPVLGNFYKKVYYDPVLGHNKSITVLPHDLVMPYYGEFENCRKSHTLKLSGRTIKERQLMGVYRNVDISSASNMSVEDEVERERKSERGLVEPMQDQYTYRVIEQLTYIDLDGDGYAEPYIVTVEHSTQEVLRIAPNFHIEEITLVEEAQDQVDVLRQRTRDNINASIAGDPSMQIRDLQTDMQTTEEEIKAIIRDNQIVKIEDGCMVKYVEYTFLPSIDGSVYGTGFGYLLGHLNESINTIINQLIDSGTLQNSSAGFIGKGAARMKKGELKFQPFQWHTVDVYGQDLKANIVPLPVQPPSAVLYNLLNLLINYAERLSSVSDMMAGDTPGQNTPATTSMAALEQGLKVFNGIFKRIYRSLRKEFYALYELNKRYLNPVSYFRVLDDGSDAKIFIYDYFGDSSDIAPAADPSIAGSELRTARAQMLAERAASVPGYKTYEVEKRLLSEMDVSNIEEIYPDPEGPNAPPPPPIPMEIQLKNRELDIRELEARTKAEIAGAKLDAEIAKLESEVMLNLAKVGSEKASVQNESMLVAIERLKAVRDGLGMIMEQSRDKEKLEVEREKINATKQAAKNSGSGNS